MFEYLNLNWSWTKSSNWINLLLMCLKVFLASFKLFLSLSWAQLSQFQTVFLQKALWDNRWFGFEILWLMLLETGVLWLDYCLHFMMGFLKNYCHGVPWIPRHHQMLKYLRIFICMNSFVKFPAYKQSLRVFFVI